MPDSRGDGAEARGAVLAVAAIGAATALSPIVWSSVLWSWSDPQVIDFLILAWQFLPFGVLLLTRQHFATAAFVVAVAFVVAATVAVDVSVDRDNGSTAALALLWVPIWLTILIGIALLVTRAVRGRRAGATRV